MDFKKIYRFLIDIIYPNRCGCCNKIIKYNKLICDSCVKAMPFVDQQVCKKCGKVRCICDKNIYYDRCYTTAFYTDVARDGIIKLKYNHGINFAEYLCEIISDKIINTENMNEIDYIVSVPMYKSQKRQRIYNQSEIISKYMSKFLNKPVFDKILIKNKKNLSQHSLNYQDRLKNVKEVFSLNNKEDVKGKTIILCDDVLTTSATANECSKVLKDNGAKNVILVVLATTNSTYFCK